MAFQVSDFTVMLDATGNIQSIQGPSGMSIPPDPGNSRYQDFLVIDTEMKLCTRQTIPEPIKSTVTTLEARLEALEAGQKTIAAKVGVVIAIPITNEVVKGL